MNILTRRLNLTTIHRKHNPRTPIEKPLRYAIANEPDRIARKPAQIKVLARSSVGGGGVHGEVFEDDRDALHGFLAERAVGGFELKGVADFVRQVADD